MADFVLHVNADGNETKSQVKRNTKFKMIIVVSQKSVTNNIIVRHNSLDLLLK